jgi:hypothetical protein
MTRSVNALKNALCVSDIGPLPAEWRSYEDKLLNMGSMIRIGVY